MHLLRYCIFIFICCSQMLQAQQKIKIGVVQFKTEKQLKQSFESIAKWLKSSTGYEIEINYIDKDELGYLLARGHLDLGVFRPLGYLNAKEEFPELEVELTHLINNKDSYKGYILVNPSAEMNALQDLQGKRFTFIKPSSTSGFLIPLGVFREKGINTDNFFSSTDFSFDHQRSIEMLQRGETDGIAVSDEDLDENSLASILSFKTISSFEVPTAAYVFAPKLDEQVKSKIIEALMDARRNPAARTLFNNPLQINGWTKANDELYNPLRRYMGIDRVKPSVQVSFQLGEHAKSVFALKGDLLEILKRRTINELRSSGRFKLIDEVQASQKQVLTIELSQVEEGYFNYHILWNNELVGDADIDEASLPSIIAPMIRYSVLSNLPLQTQLVFDGKQWFASYGLNDGVNGEDYTYYVSTSEGTVNAKVLIANNLNVIFEAHDSFKQNNPVRIVYSRLDLFSTETESSSAIIPTTISEFWEDDFWDKFGLIVSVSVAATSGLLTWYFSTRKKRNFKKVLRDASQLLEAYVEDSNRTKTSLIEMKDMSSQMLEKGEITENQFLIIKHRLDEIEQQIKEQHLKG